MYLLDHAMLEKCDPELIITQELCDVCAIGYQHVADAVRRLDERADTKRVVLSVEPQTLSQILEATLRIGEAAGVSDRAAGLVDDMRRRIDAIGQVGRRAMPKPRVLAMEWLDPPYTAGHWVPEMIRIAGGQDDLGRHGGFSYEITWSDVVRYEPDVVVLIPCSFDLARTIRDATPLSRLPEWQHLPAVQKDASTRSTGDGISAATARALSTGWRSWARSYIPTSFCAARPPMPGSNSVNPGNATASACTSARKLC